MRPTEARQQMQPCDSLTAMHMRTYYAYYEPQQRVPDQGLPLPQQGVPYQVQQVPQLLTVQQQPSSCNLEWAPPQYLCEPPSMSPRPQWLPTSWTLPPCAASGATTASAAAVAGFGPSTQEEYVEQVDGSDSDNNPKDVTPPWKKQKVQTYRKHAHHKLLGKKNLWPIKKDLRGVSRSSI